MKNIASIALVATFALASLTACGGGGGGGGAAGGAPTIPVPTQTNSPVTNSEAQGTITLTIPAIGATYNARSKASFGGTRRPDYISPSTNGAAWSAVGTGQTTGTYSGVADLSSGSPLCTGSGASRTCNIPFAVPAGTYTFTLDTFDAAPVSGAIPGGANQLATSTLNTTIQLNAQNNLAFVLSGIVKSITITNGVGATTYFSTPGDGSSHTVTITVNAKDADGNIITGSAPYASALPITIGETGGTGHMKLVINGTIVASGNITKPADTLAVQYDGGGANTDYASLNVGNAAEGGPVAVTVSPMFVSPVTLSFAKLVTSGNLAIAEPGATGSSGIAYSVTPSSCPSTTSGSVVGSNATATGTVSINVPGGTNTSCSAKVADILGTTITVPVTYAVPGPITPGAPTGTGVTGTCASTVSFSGTGQVASIVVTDPGYAGSLTVGSTNTSVATVSATGFTVNVTAGATAGTATINISDTAGNSYACPVGVTLTGGSVSYNGSSPAAFGFAL